MCSSCGLGGGQSSECWRSKDGVFATLNVAPRMPRKRIGLADTAYFAGTLVSPPPVHKRPFLTRRFCVVRTSRGEGQRRLILRPRRSARSEVETRGFERFWRHRRSAVAGGPIGGPPRPSAGGPPFRPQPVSRHRCQVGAEPTPHRLRPTSCILRGVVSRPKLVPSGR